MENVDYTLDRTLNDHAATNMMNTTLTDGYIGEFNFAFGGNIKNIVYFGGSLGVQSINYTETNYYEESYENNTVPYPINFMMYDQNVRISGSGVNFKAGVTVRPVGGLRIGFAVHVPTFITVTEQYSSAMRVNFMEATGISSVTKTTETNSNTYLYITPTNLFAGVS